ncbi:hypothetical protein A2686_02615 [Candidatus Woesebacteria bacterium RIFCSPHIGHO2_01_FULL_38_10]|uniref:Uncharacterized protein n=1 Tax=Candidatus Woesebacteria bacterium RIFCSPLOWO2_01_FULL_39_10b TaxID=1802517 RepID=A0A1F8B8W2_9BACT|nr:MAG: hypothetical protein A2686_02615 [Candidatus Woesebacteria bacterium RIFCSPHIGHO2_01_FULL_38_10]OGM60461.1 MAG: hypothetical protein A2892_00305 [Candidatus Woesebacteria bacterium RIFCSPLOWO2_01_FULL_39_10b]
MVEKEASLPKELPREEMSTMDLVARAGASLGVADQVQGHNTSVKSQGGKPFSLEVRDDLLVKALEDLKELQRRQRRGIKGRFFPRRWEMGRWPSENKFGKYRIEHGNFSLREAAQTNEDIRNLVEELGLTIVR